MQLSCVKLGVILLFALLHLLLLLLYNIHFSRLCQTVVICVLLICGAVLKLGSNFSRRRDVICR